MVPNEYGVNVKPVEIVAVTAVPSNVPLVGNVTLVFAVRVPVKVYAPLYVTLPPMVIVEAPLLTPVPPCVPVIGSVIDVPQAEPVETAMPAPG
jgi:hypothetical protein